MDKMCQTLEHLEMMSALLRVNITLCSQIELCNMPVADRAAETSTRHCTFNCGSTPRPALHLIRVSRQLSCRHSLSQVPS